MVTAGGLSIVPHQTRKQSERRLREAEEEKIEQHQKIERTKTTKQTNKLDKKLQQQTKNANRKKRAVVFKCSFSFRPLHPPPPPSAPRPPPFLEFPFPTSTASLKLCCTVTLQEKSTAHALALRMRIPGHNYTILGAMEEDGSPIRCSRSVQRSCDYNPTTPALHGAARPSSESVLLVRERAANKEGRKKITVMGACLTQKKKRERGREAKRETWPRADATPQVSLIAVFARFTRTR